MRPKEVNLCNIPAEPVLSFVIFEVNIAHNTSAIIQKCLSPFSPLHSTPVSNSLLLVYDFYMLPSCLLLFWICFTLQTDCLLLISVLILDQVNIILILPALFLHPNINYQNHHKNYSHEHFLIHHTGLLFKPKLPG